MPRKPRQLVDGGYYHLIARGNNRLYIFNEPEDFIAFKGLLNRCAEKFSHKLYHYCLMSNHFHLLISIDQGLHLPKMMQFLLYTYSLFYKKKTPYTGHLWEGRYKSLVVDKESYMLECGRYIERNPVRAKLCQRPEDYAWSSYPYYAFGNKDHLITEDPYYETLASNEKDRMTGYRNFVKIENPYEGLVDKSLMSRFF